MKEIKLEPNYKRLFAQFAREAMLQGDHITRYGEDIWTRTLALRAAQAVLAPLNVAIQAATSVEDVQKLRDVLAGIVNKIDTTATGLENAIGGVVEPGNIGTLLAAANAVVDSWSGHNLAPIVNGLREALESMNARFDAEETDDDEGEAE